MLISNAAGLNPALTGGAILSGSFFGDRCSPMSTSALLVSELTGTDLFENIKKMTRTGLVPFLLACGVYALAGLGVHAAPAGDGARALLAEGFCLHPAALAPADAILLLCLLRVNVKIAMGVSLLLSAVVAAAVQGTAPAELLRAEASAPWPTCLPLCASPRPMRAFFGRRAFWTAPGGRPSGCAAGAGPLRECWCRRF